MGDKVTTATLELNAIDNVTSVVRQVSTSVQSLTRQYEVLKVAAAGIAAAFSAGAVASFIRDAIAMEASMARLAERAGTSAEALSSLMTVAKISHTEMDQVATAMGKLAKAMVESESGTGKAAQVFEALGINVKGADGQMRATQEVLQEFGQKLFAMKDQTLAVAFAQEVLGKNGAALIPFLYELARAGELHAKFTNAEAAAAKELEANLAKLQSGANRLWITLANFLVPALADMTGNIADAKSQGSGLLQFWVELGKLVAATLSAMPGTGWLGDRLATRLFEYDQQNRASREAGTGKGTGPAQGSLDVQNPFGASAAERALGWTPQQEEMFQARRAAWKESEAITLKIAAAADAAAAAAEKLDEQLDKQAKQYLDMLDPSRLYMETQEKLYALLAAGKLTLEETLAIQRKLFEAKNGVKDLGEAASVAGDAGHAMGLSFTSSIERIIFDTGKAINAMDLLKAAAMDVAKIIYGRNVAEPLAKMTQSGVSDLWASLFGGGSNAYATGSMTSESAGMLGQAFHSGGIVGVDGSGRYIHPAYFEHAPRFHEGLAPDEFPAILQDGEGVFTQAQMKAMGGAGGDTFVIDARGADRAGLARLENMIQSVNGSIEHRAVTAVGRQRMRRAVSTPG